MYENFILVVRLTATLKRKEGVVQCTAKGSKTIRKKTSMKFTEASAQSWLKAEFRVETPHT